MNSPSKPLSFHKAAKAAGAASPMDILRKQGASIATVLRQSGGRPVGLVLDLDGASDALIADIEAACAPARDPLAEAESRLADYRAGRAGAYPLDVLDRIDAGEHPLRVHRERRGLTQKQLADAVGSSAEYLGQIERGTRHAGRQLAARLAAALNVRAADLEPDAYS